MEEKRVLIVADGHYYRNKNGIVYSESVFDYRFYSRYLNVFKHIWVIARISSTENIPSNCKIASGNGVTFLPIPESRGLIEHIKVHYITRKLINKYVSESDAAIIRVPGVVANITERLYRKTKKPYVLEVVVDPWEYFSKGTINTIYRPVLRLVWTKSLKSACLHANGVSYVTLNYLQKRYPCIATKQNKEESLYFTSSYSSVELPDDKFGTMRIYTTKNQYTIIHVANSFSGYGKGHITLLRATKIVLDKGYNIRTIFVGDGPLKSEFEHYANELGISSNVVFTGRLSSGDAVRGALKNADIFVFPTKAEGLPRVVLEAMAMGLPVLSSPVCGIPEIVDREYLFNSDSAQDFSNAIIRLISNPEIMTNLSRKNINIAYEFRSSKLQDKRISFYKKLDSLRI